MRHMTAHLFLPPHVTTAQEALVLNPSSRDRYVWPMYCLANRLYSAGPDAVHAAGLLDVQPPQPSQQQQQQQQQQRRNPDEHRLFASAARIGAEQVLLTSLVAGVDVWTAVQDVRVGGNGDDHGMVWLATPGSKGTDVAANHQDADHPASAQQPPNYAALLAFVQHVRW
jgi:hypothetical protein